MLKAPTWSELSNSARRICLRRLRLSNCVWEAKAPASRNVPSKRNPKSLSIFASVLVSISNTCWLAPRLNSYYSTSMRSSRSTANEPEKISDRPTGAVSFRLKNLRLSLGVALKSSQWPTRIKWITLTVLEVSLLNRCKVLGLEEAIQETSLSQLIQVAMNCRHSPSQAATKCKAIMETFITLKITWTYTK